MTSERMAEIRALYEAASEGPWVWDVDRIIGPGDGVYGDTITHEPCGAQGCENAFTSPGDAAFIAAARTAVPELLNEVEHLRAGNALLVRQRNAEEEHAMLSGGILSDVCDIAFGDPERASCQGYEGIREQVAGLRAKLARVEALAAEWDIDSHGRNIAQGCAADQLRAVLADEVTDVE